jgi:hypothetical protein
MADLIDGEVHEHATDPPDRVGLIGIGQMVGFPLGDRQQEVLNGVRGHLSPPAWMQLPVENAGRPQVQTINHRSQLGRAT